MTRQASALSGHTGIAGFGPRTDEEVKVDAGSSTRSGAPGPSAILDKRPPKPTGFSKSAGRQAIAAHRPASNVLGNLRVARERLAADDPKGAGHEVVGTFADMLIGNAMPMPPAHFVDAVRPAAQFMKIMDSRYSEVPPENANEVHARILSGCDLVLGGKMDLNQEGHDHAIALGVAAQLFNRWGPQLGMGDDQPMPAVELLDKSGGIGGRYRISDFCVEFYKAGGRLNSAVVAHESLHVAQWLEADLKNRTLNDEALARDPGRLPRCGAIRLSPTLPRDLDPSASGYTKYTLYATSPIEIQSFADQLHLVKLETSAVPRSPHFDEAGLDALADLIQRAGLMLNVAEAPKARPSWLGSYFAAAPDARLLSRMEPKIRSTPSGKLDRAVEAPKFMASAGHIFFLSDRFNRAMNSQVWDVADTAELQQTMKRMNAVLLKTPWGRGLNGEELLAKVAGTLESAWNKVSDLKGDALRQPAGDAPTAAQWSKDKYEPWRLLEVSASATRQTTGPDALDAGGAHAGGLSFRFKQGTALRALLDEKKACYFFTEVSRLRRKIQRGLAIESEDITNPVMRLAARLCGTSMAHLPPVIWPEVNMYPAKSTVISPWPDLVDGANQRRKASFDADLWLIDAPLHTLRDNAHLEGQLTKLAFDVAEQMNRLMQAFKKVHVILDSERTYFVAMLHYRLSRALGENMAGLCDQFVAENPESVAAKIRNAPKHERNTLWHIADRPDLKATAQETGNGGDIARSAYQAGVWQDWHLDMNAMRRALVAADWSQELRPEFEANVGERWTDLSAKAKQLAVVAASLEGGQVFRRASDDLQGDESDDEESWMPLRDLISAQLVTGDPRNPATLRWVSSRSKEMVSTLIDPDTLEIRNWRIPLLGSV